MSQCIICREEKSEFSVEHVIPTALGGRYLIKTVCASCNSNLGSFVDSKLVNHKFSEFQRYLLNLKGRSKNGPNPFSGNHDLAEDEGIKVQLRLDRDGIPAPYVVTQVSYEDVQDQGGGTRVSISIDASDEGKLDGILAKISRKLKVPFEELKKVDRPIRRIEQPYIKCSLSIDLAEFKIGLLKIAYEFSVDTISDYFSDASAIEISKILKDADYKSVENYVTIGNGFDHGVFNSLREYLDLESKKHYLLLVSTKNNGLLGLIHLHNTFSVGVKLSSSRYPDDLVVIGINDIEKKEFRKVYPNDLMKEIYAIPELRFEYYFTSEQSLHEFMALQSEENFGFYSADDSHPIFDGEGNRLGYDLYELMQKVEHLVTTEKIENWGIAHTFPLKEPVYLKITPSNKLVQIVAVREEYRQTSKL